LEDMEKLKVDMVVPLTFWDEDIFQLTLKPTDILKRRRVNRNELRK
jgi:hypothetical protein